MPPLLPRAPASPSLPVWRRRRWLLALLTVLVALVHLWLADDVMPPLLGEGAADTMPRRIDVAFVRELAQAAPAVAAAPARRPRPPRQAALQPAAPGASAAAVAPPDPVVAQAVPALAPLPASAAADDAASAPVAAVTVATATPPDTALSVSQTPPMPASDATTGFDWPPSTRLSYRFTGNYRGEVSGLATVEWLRLGSRYQVQMEVIVGSTFAPLLRRRVTSEGEVTPEGLSPRRYDEETKAIVGAARRNTIVMEGNTVKLANGNEVPRPPGLQDSASQFVHLTWLFTTQPQRLEVGQSIELPLALPRRVEPWIYDVVGTETLLTPAGPVPAVHVKPRREPRPGDSLTAEIWVAPSLQYLPVRIMIRQDADTFIDMQIERLPQQAVERK